MGRESERGKLMSHTSVSKTSFSSQTATRMIKLMTKGMALILYATHGG